MGTVVTYAPKDGGGVTEHEIAARIAVAKAPHPLAGPRARRPRGWSDAFPERAAQALLEDGPVRIKHGRGMRASYCGIQQAQAFDAAAKEFNGMFASRRNYAGRDRPFPRRRQPRRPAHQVHAGGAS